MVKQGIREKFDEMRQMGIRTVMITGDNPLTAAAIAQEAGVDDFLAEATPEAKMDLIKAEQEGGKLVAMTGDGTNDAPALAQADVGVAMNTGTTAAKEAGNMVDLDSNPTKLIDVVEIGKQLLITRGSLTTFSIANDVAKYFAIIPALFVATYPQLNTLNIMKLHSPDERGALGGDLQRPGDRGPHPAGPAGREVPGRRLGGHPAPQRLHLRGGRDHRPVHLHQAHRPHPRRPARLLMEALANARSPPPLRHLRRHLPTSFFGFVYAFAGTGVAQLLFKHQANGSLTANGSTLIGQNWAAANCPGHPGGSCVFHGRPDDTGPYAAVVCPTTAKNCTPPRVATTRSSPTASAASRRPPTSGPAPRRCSTNTEQLIAYWQSLGVDDPTPDLVTTSGSGYDPDITPQDATVQIPMVAKATGICALGTGGPHQEADPQRPARLPRQQLHRRPAAQRGPRQAASERWVRRDELQRRDRREGR